MRQNTYDPKVFVQSHITSLGVIFVPPRTWARKTYAEYPSHTSHTKNKYLVPRTTPPYSSFLFDTMTIVRSSPSPLVPTKSMVIVTPPSRQQERMSDKYLLSRNSLPALLSIGQDDRSCAKFRLQPRYKIRINSIASYNTSKKRPILTDDADDDADAFMQSPTSHRRYMRRGSRTPAMLLLCRHASLLEMATNIAAANTTNTMNECTNTPISSASAAIPYMNSIDHYNNNNNSNKNDTDVAFCHQFHDALQMNHSLQGQRDTNTNDTTHLISSVRINSTSTINVSSSQCAKPPPSALLPSIPQL